MKPVELQKTYMVTESELKKWLELPSGAILVSFRPQLGIYSDMNNRVWLIKTKEEEEVVRD